MAVVFVELVLFELLVLLSTGGGGVAPEPDPPVVELDGEVELDEASSSSSLSPSSHEAVELLELEELVLLELLVPGGALPDPLLVELFVPLEAD